MPRGSHPRGESTISFAQTGTEARNGQTKEGALAPHGEVERETRRIWSDIMLVLVTFLAFATMVGLLWLSPKSSFTQLGDSTVYGGVAFVALLIAYAALMLRKAHQYTGRLVLIGAVGLAVMLVGWALRSS